jgi:23S rRNA (adenine2030-N6)-methyltransferase
MLSYQHIYHAGNFADVHKHAILARLVKAFKAKPGGFRVMDTHAGRGIYDLSAEEAQRNKEFDNGITKFIDDTSPLLADYLSIVKKYSGEGLQKYPGSAAVARGLMKASDKLVCIERHPGEFSELQSAMAGAENTELYLGDGLQALIEAVPFPERRGLTVIDPSYEIKTEYAELPALLRNAWKKWPQGCYMVWFPMLDTNNTQAGGGHMKLLTGLRASSIKDVLVSELRLKAAPGETFRMYGTGIAIVNPPFPPDTIDQITQYIAGKLGDGAEGKTFWLDNMQINPETGMVGS